MVIQLAFGSVVILLSIALMVAVLLQNNDSKMSGTITGSAETFFGQSKADTRDRKLSRLTVALSVVFAIVVIVMYALVS